MAITISFPRQKLTATNTVMEDILADTPFEDGDAILLRVYLDGLTIDDTNIGTDLSAATGFDVTYSTGAATITTTTEGLWANVRPGDVISAAQNPGDFSGQVVSSISTDGLVITLDSNPDAAGGSQSTNETLTFTPGDIDSTLYYIRLDHNISGTNLVVTPSISVFDGSLVADGTGPDPDSDGDVVSYTDGTQKVFPTSTINLDSYLTEARIARLP